MTGYYTDQVDAFKRKPGGQPIGEKAMTAAERKRRSRELIEQAIKNKLPDSWDEKICLAVLSNGNHHDKQQAAWQQLGQLRGWLPAPTEACVDEKG